MDIVKRLEVLTEWEAQAKAAGAKTIPDHAVLAQLAQTWEAGNPDPAVYHRWADFLADLFWLADNATPNALTHASARQVMRRRNEPLEPLGWEPKSMSKIDLLREWRKQKGIEGLRDGVLISIANAPLSESAIVQRLPPNLRAASGEILALLTNVASANTSSAIATTVVSDAGPTPPGVASDPKPAAVATDTGPTPPGVVEESVAEAAVATSEVTATATVANPARQNGVIAFIDDEDDLRVRAGAFIGRDMTAPLTVPEKLDIRRNGGNITLRWSHNPELGPVIYRVVCSPRKPSFSPETATQIALTRETLLTFPYEAKTAATIFQVWAYQGENESEASCSHPIRLAEEADITPAQDFKVDDDGSQMVLSWKRIPDTANYIVYRGTDEDLLMGTAGMQPVATLDGDISGWVDNCCPPNTDVTYIVYTEASIPKFTDSGPMQALQRSISTQCRIRMRGKLEVVNDLDVRFRSQDSGDVFDLVWTAPESGEVVVYRSDQPPAQGVRERVFNVADLPQMGFFDDKNHRPNFPIRPDGSGRMLMQDVPWPDEWERVWFTPVTVLEEQIVVGPSKVFVRPGNITDLKVHERMYSQMVTFRWRGSTSQVQIYQMAEHENIYTVLESGQPLQTISREDYRKYGGLTLANPSLNNQGCTVVVVPMSHGADGTQRGEPAKVEYAGLRQGGYKINVERASVFGKANHYFVTCYGDAGLANAPLEFAAVYNEERLPLDLNDGVVVPVVPNYPKDYQPGSGEYPIGASLMQWRYPSFGPQSPEWAFKLEIPKNTRGFIRVFPVGLTAEQGAQLAWTDITPEELMLR
ncbi:MAG: hypothetical protein ACRDAX_03280 [Propionibacteriaceae bacterium]